jgi:hypothetical protein
MLFSQTGVGRTYFHFVCNSEPFLAPLRRDLYTAWERFVFQLIPVNFILKFCNVSSPSAAFDCVRLDLLWLAFLSGKLFHTYPGTWHTHREMRHAYVEVYVCILCSAYERVCATRYPEINKYFYTIIQEWVSRRWSPSGLCLGGEIIDYRWLSPIAQARWINY